MSNYVARIATVERVLPIPGRDAIHVAVVLGEQVIVSVNVQVGYTGVLFVAGTQLSADYCKVNNLHRDSSLNADTTKQGYFDNNRKVRVQPFAKVRSEAYFADIESLAYTGVDLSTLTLGTTFEDLNGHNVCKKFMDVKSAQKVGNPKEKKVRLKLKEAPMFKEHLNTANFKHEMRKIQPGDLVSIQAKVHGTSVRYTNTKVFTSLPKWKQFVNKFVPVFPEFSWTKLVGTRRVVLFSEDKVGFHGPEQYRYDWLKVVEPFLTKGMTIYGEIAGYANSKPIMQRHDTTALKDKKIKAKFGDVVEYKYGCHESASRFHVYRITYTTEDGDVIDFTQPQLVAWCNARNILPSLDVVPPFIFDGDYDKLAALVEELTERPNEMTADYIDPTHPSEGVIVRADGTGTTPVFLKSKSYLFRCLEGLCEEVDVEDVS